MLEMNVHPLGFFLVTKIKSFRRKRNIWILLSVSLYLKGFYRID
jgi:hypothetical protein